MQVIIALRDPVARTLSSYNYARANMNTVLELMGAESYTESFLDMTKRQITEIDNAGINPDTGALLMCLICSYACKLYSNGHLTS